MKIRKLVNIVSLGLLVYLLLNVGSQVDIAQTKNDHLIAFKKAEVDKIANIDLAKNEAKKNLDTIRSIYKSHSSDSKTQMLIIAFLIIIQTTLIFMKPKLNGI